MQYYLRNLFILFLLFATCLCAQGLSGSATIQLSGPASNDQIIHVKAIARSLLKTDLVKWLLSEKNSKIDTLNALDRFHLDMLADTILNRSKAEPSYKGKELTIFYSIDENATEEALQAFNTSVQNAAIQSWKAVTTAQTKKDGVALFKASINAYSYATAFIGPPIVTPGSQGGILREDARKIVQDVFNHTKIQSSDMIIAGKIGHPADQAPKVNVSIDSIPLPDLLFIGSLQNGKTSFRSSSDSLGQLSLNNLNIPIVANGTLFYLTPDLGKILGTSLTISPKDLNIQLGDGQIQTFMYKVTRPSFTLNYKIAPDTSINLPDLPADFNSSATLKKYLIDSCFLADAQAGIPPDFIITLDLVISNTATDITDEVGRKLSGEIVIKGLSLETPRTEQKKIELVKHFDKVQKIPYGLFLWDVNTAIKQGIRSVLNQF